jgi:L-ribulose-5-phosphate 3-epimerase
MQRAAPHLRMLAVKDFYWERGRDGRWRVVDCPLGEGMVDWKKYLAEVRAARFAGPISLHVEYETGGRTPVEKREKMLVAMVRDRTRLAALIAEGAAGAPAPADR